MKRLIKSLKSIFSPSIYAGFELVFLAFLCLLYFPLHEMFNNSVSVSISKVNILSSVLLSIVFSVNMFIFIVDRRKFLGKLIGVLISVCVLLFNEKLTMLVSDVVSNFIVIPQSKLIIYNAMLFHMTYLICYALSGVVYSICRLSFFDKSTKADKEIQKELDESESTKEHKTKKGEVDDMALFRRKNKGNEESNEKLKAQPETSNDSSKVADSPTSEEVKTTEEPQSNEDVADKKQKINVEAIALNYCQDDSVDELDSTDLDVLEDIAKAYIGGN